jgi:paraquat-inducible protein A
VESAARRARSRSRAAAAALGALVLFPAAIALPALEVERFGHRHVTGVGAGVIDLLAEGNVVIGLVVLICSVVLPPAKLVTLLLLCARAGPLGARERAGAWRLVEATGRWGMIDVLLAAVLVAALKLGDVVDVTPGPGLIAFAGMVGLSLAASAWFDPRALWEAS